MAWISVAEAARRLGCDPRTVRNYIKAKRLTLYEVGGPRGKLRPLQRLSSAEVDDLVRPVESS